MRTGSSLERGEARSSGARERVLALGHDQPWDLTPMGSPPGAQADAQAQINSYTC